MGDGCRKGSARYLVAGPKGELLYAADGRKFELVELPQKHGQLWSVDCGADKGAWVAAAEPSAAYHVEGTKILRAVTLPGAGLRSVSSRGQQVYVGELTTGRVWDVSPSRPKVVGQTLHPEVMALAIVNSTTLFALSISTEGSVEGKIPPPSPRSRGGGALELLQPQQPQALVWSADGETPLTLLKTTTEILVGTDLGFVYSFSTRAKGDGSPLSASSAQRRFVRDQRRSRDSPSIRRAYSPMAVGCGAMRGRASPTATEVKLSTQVIELTGDHCERNRRAFKRFSGVSVKIQQAKDGLNGRTVPAVQPAMLRSSFSFAPAVT